MPNPVMFKLIAIGIICSLTLLHQDAGENSIKYFVQQSTIELIPMGSANVGAINLDYEKIGKNIGHYPIIMIGEQDHGDATTISVKINLVKLLHEKFGFNCLLFESDLFGLNDVDSVEKKINLDSLSFYRNITENIFPVWTACNQFLPLADYLYDANKKGNPLLLSGFDIQFNGLKSQLEFKSGFASELRKYKIDLPGSISKIIDTVINSVRTNFIIGQKSYQQLSIFTRRVYSKIGTKKTDGFWRLLIETLEARAKQILTTTGDIDASLTIREKQMAKNIAWLRRNRFQNEKIIIWAANSHIAKNTTGSFEKNFGKYSSMAEYLTGYIKADSIYGIGFASFQGKYGRPYSPSANIPSPKPDGFENWINANFQYAFTDFTSFRKKNPGNQPMFFMNNPGHASVLAKWTDIYDGIFYIKNMNPCNY
jgi:erythromycin esterase